MANRKERRDAKFGRVPGLTSGGLPARNPVQTQRAQPASGAASLRFGQQLSGLRSRRALTSAAVGASQLTALSPGVGANLRPFSQRTRDFGIQQGRVQTAQAQQFRLQEQEIEARRQDVFDRSVREDARQALAQRREGREERGLALRERGTEREFGLKERRFEAEFGEGGTREQRAAGKAEQEAVRVAEAEKKEAVRVTEKERSETRRDASEKRTQTRFDERNKQTLKPFSVGDRATFRKEAERRARRKQEQLARVKARAFGKEFDLDEFNDSALPTDKEIDKFLPDVIEEFGGDRTPEEAVPEEAAPVTGEPEAAPEQVPEAAPEAPKQSNAEKRKSVQQRFPKLDRSDAEDILTRSLETGQSIDEILDELVAAGILNERAGRKSKRNLTRG